MAEIEVSFKRQSPHRWIEMTIKDGGVVAAADSRLYSHLTNPEFIARGVAEMAASLFVAAVMMNSALDTDVGLRRWLDIEIDEKRERTFSGMVSSEGWFAEKHAMRRDDDGNWWYQADWPISKGRGRGFVATWYKVTGPFIRMLEREYRRAIRMSRAIIREQNLLQ